MSTDKKSNYDSHCFLEGKRIANGKAYVTKQNIETKCVEGDLILLNCFANEKIVKNGVKLMMNDNIERQCSNGLLKPVKCI